ncbi:MAG TPA: hypothetical protein VGG99_23105 [Acetobacteraceae bacterium]|jgi:hypothetical protein
MASPDNMDALTTVIKALKPLSSEDRRRMVDAAMVFLGEAAEGKPAVHKRDTDGPNEEAGDEGYSAPIGKWMRQYGISPNEMDHVFHFKGMELSTFMASPAGLRTSKHEMLTF